MKRIINIVEDEKDLNELVRSYLEKEGYVVNSYLTFDSAYSHIDDYCDLWILDIMLDDKSGFDLIEAIKERKEHLPVVFMSARDKEFDRIIGLEKGSDDYITSATVAGRFSGLKGRARMSKMLPVHLLHPERWEQKNNHAALW